MARQIGTEVVGVVGVVVVAIVEKASIQEPHQTTVTIEERVEAEKVLTLL